MSQLLFSLIVATYGRSREIEELLGSLTNQDISNSTFEVIVVDQNTDIDLNSIVKHYQNHLNLKHLKTNKKGLSYNRNIGIAEAKGEILAFPDDDCYYYPDTLSSVLKVFDQNPKITLVLGRIMDRGTGKNIIRNWPLKSKLISKFTFFTHYSSITLFTKTHQQFDERLGVGSYFGSYEDADFVFNIIAETGSAIYDPQVEMWHPENDINSFSEKKIFRYGLGFGGLVRKHWSFVFAYLLAGVLAYHSLKLVKGLVRGDQEEVRKRWLSITSRVRGFLEFPRGKE